MAAAELTCTPPFSAEGLKIPEALQPYMMGITFVPFVRTLVKGKLVDVVRTKRGSALARPRATDACPRCRRRPARWCQGPERTLAASPCATGRATHRAPRSVGRAFVAHPLHSGCCWCPAEVLTHVADACLATCYGH